MPDTNLRYRVPPEIVGMALSLKHRTWNLRDALLYLPQLLSGGALAGCFLFSSWAEYRLHSLLAFFVANILCLFLEARRQQRRISEEWGEVSLSLREEGLLVTQQAWGQTLYFWRCIGEIRERQEVEKKDNSSVFIIMKSTQALVIPVPFSAFPTEAARREFIAAIKAKMAASAQENGRIAEEATASHQESSS
jgi:hypothetical protein